MPNQYFENNIDLPSEINKITYYCYNKVFTFYTDNGVFSKHKIDYGSSLLLKEVVITSSIRNVLDVGCGYGPIGLVIASCNSQLQVEMIDVNERAILLANKNANENKVSNVFIHKSDIYENVTGLYDLIITNPPIRAGKQIVHKILAEAYDHLNTQGELWCVIQKKQGAESAIKLLNSYYKAVKIVKKDKGYWIIQASK